MEFLKSGFGLEITSGMILPALATCSVIILLTGKLYHKIRKNFSVRVNCWFCNTNTRVPFNSSNSWYCPSCDQYNGFSSDGGYNRILPEQFNEKLNSGEWCSKNKNKTTTSNGLCRFCNINLELKIHQLAQYIPTNKNNYDEEIQQYSNKLERVYRLCSRCQGVLEKTLNTKQQQFVTNQQYSFKPTVEPSVFVAKKGNPHTVSVGLTSVLGVGLLISVMPSDWLFPLLDIYSPPEHLVDHIEQYLPKGINSTAFLTLGVVIQLFDCAYTRDSLSFIKLLLWSVLLTLTQVSLDIDHYIPAFYMVACAVFFISTILEHRGCKLKNVATVKPVQLQKLDRTPGKVDTTKRKTKVTEEDANILLNSKHSPKSVVSDCTPSQSIPSPFQSPTEDFGFAKLNVNSRRTTRSQTKHFQAKQYGSQTATDLFKPKPVQLTPPKLQFEQSIDYQLNEQPLTRSSSQSSGFVSLSHQKDFEDYRSRSPSIADNIESVSQCGGALTSYQGSPFGSPAYPHPFGMPFSQFAPYTIMHFTSQPPIDRYYQYSNMLSYDSSFNTSILSSHKDVTNTSWLQKIKGALSSMLFFLLILTNFAVLWKVFGEEYFKLKT